MVNWSTFKHETDRTIAQHKNLYRDYRKKDKTVVFFSSGAKENNSGEKLTNGWTTGGDPSPLT